MIRTLDVLLVGGMIASAIWTFNVKHKAEISAAKVASLQKQIGQEKDRINLLRADWALLNQPARLQELVKIFGEELNLQNLRADQIVNLDELPAIALPDDPIAVLANEANSIDDLVTGSVAPAAGQPIAPLIARPTARPLFNNAKRRGE